MTLNLGIDLHGTLDSNPDLFFNVIRQLTSDNYIVKIFIISGQKYSNEIETQLINMSPRKVRWWDGYFSSETLLNDLCVNYYFDQNVLRPIFSEYAWNISKSIICAFNNINLYIDDNIEYLKFMDIPTILFNHKLSAQNIYNYIKEKFKR